MRIINHSIVSAGIILLVVAVNANAGQDSKRGQATLAKQAKITMQQAEAAAVKREPGTIKSKELEKEHGKLIYSFDIQTGSGMHEVNVDAKTGEVIEDSVETPANEATEKKQDAAAAKAHKTPPAK